MPRPVSSAILQAKKRGNRFNLVHIELATPIYTTDNNFDYTYNSNLYESNGLLLNVDAGAMTAGVNSNDWEVTLSAVLDSMYSNVLSQNLLNRWVYHYVAYYDEDEAGINIIGVETKKFGQILSISDKDDNTSGDVTITVTGPLGNTDQANVLKTNVTSHQRRFTGDFFFKYAHETDYKIKSTVRTGSGLIGRVIGTIISDFPEDIQ